MTVQFEVTFADAAPIIALGVDKRAAEVRAAMDHLPGAGMTDWLAARAVKVRKLRKAEMRLVR